MKQTELEKAAQLGERRFKRWLKSKINALRAQMSCPPGTRDYDERQTSEAFIAGLDAVEDLLAEKRA